MHFESHIGMKGADDNRKSSHVTERQTGQPFVASGLDAEKGVCSLGVGGESIMGKHNSLR
jgi:hypothetical protein